MIELCTVKKVSGKYCYIELVRNEKCESCKVCAFNRKEKIVVPAACGIAVEAGDTVECEMPTVSVGVGALLIYAIPIALILIGALIGLAGGVWLQIGLAGGGLVLGLAAALVIDRAYRRRPGVIPAVIRKVQSERRLAANDGSEKQQGEQTCN